MATAFLRVSGSLDDIFPCGEPGCALCSVGHDGSVVVHGEPLDRARALARELAIEAPALDRAIGFDAPVGRRYGVEDLAPAVTALEALLAAIGARELSQSAEASAQELRRALAIFRAGRAHHRPVVLEV